MDFVEVKPHARDQSNKVVANNSRSLSSESTESSNMRLFLSLQIIDITQCGTKFQTFEECIPNQFLQLTSKSITLKVEPKKHENTLEQSSITEIPYHNVGVDDPLSPLQLQRQY